VHRGLRDSVLYGVATCRSGHVEPDKLCRNYCQVISSRGQLDLSIGQDSTRVCLKAEVTGSCVRGRSPVRRLRKL
jgi:hypothetical protein